MIDIEENDCLLGGGDTSLFLYFFTSVGLSGVELSIFQPRLFLFVFFLQYYH
eukprot:UN05597